MKTLHLTLKQGRMVGHHIPADIMSRRRSVNLKIIIYKKHKT